MSLIERLEAAEVGSRELDYAIMDALGYSNISDPRDAIECWRGLDGKARYENAVYSRSLDAALALAERVLPGHAMNVCKDQGPPDGPDFRWSSVIARHSLEGPVGRPGWWFGVSDTPALALCIAILKSKEAAK